MAVGPGSGRLSLHPSHRFPRGYSVQVSADQIDRQEVGRQDADWSRMDVSFAPAVARYVHPGTTPGSDIRPWGIAEFAVWRSSPTWLRRREAWYEMTGYSVAV